MVFRTTSLLTAAHSSVQHWAQLSQRLGTLHHLTTAYHPQANGMVERSHRQLKDALKACTAGADWPSHLPWVLLGLRAAPKEDSSISSAELLYGAPLVLSGQLPGVPEPPPAVFYESSRAAPSHVPARGPSRSSKRSLSSSRVLLLCMLAAAVPNRRSHSLTAGPSQWCPTLQSSLYWI